MGIPHTVVGNEYWVCLLRLVKACTTAGQYSQMLYSTYIDYTVRYHPTCMSVCLPCKMSFELVIHCFQFQSNLVYFLVKAKTHYVRSVYHSFLGLVLPTIYGVVGVAMGHIPLIQNVFT